MKLLPQDPLDTAMWTIYAIGALGTFIVMTTMSILTVRRHHLGRAAAMRGAIFAVVGSICWFALPLALAWEYFMHYRPDQEAAKHHGEPNETID